MKRLYPNIKKWKVKYNPEGTPLASRKYIVEVIEEVVWEKRRINPNVEYGGLTDTQVQGYNWQKIGTGVHVVQMVGEDVFKSMKKGLGRAAGFNLKRFKSLDDLNNLEIMGSHSGFNKHIYGGDIDPVLLDVKATLRHEIAGHGMGFGHVSDEYSTLNNKAIPHHWMMLSTLFDRTREAEVYRGGVVDCTPQATQNQRLNNWETGEITSLLLHLPLVRRDEEFFEITLIRDRVEGGMQYLKAQVLKVDKPANYINAPEIVSGELYAPRVNYSNFYTAFGFKFIRELKPNVWEFMMIDVPDKRLWQQDYSGNITEIPWG